MNSARYCENMKSNSMNDTFGIEAEPRWGWALFLGLPRVARASQPWAGGHNPFGIETDRAANVREKTALNGTRTCGVTWTFTTGADANKPMPNFISEDQI